MLRFGTIIILSLVFLPSAPAENWSEDFEDVSSWADLEAKGWNVEILYGGYLDLARPNPYTYGTKGLGAGSDPNVRIGDHLHRTWTPDVPTDAMPVKIEHWIGFADSATALEKWTFIRDGIGGAWLAVGADPDHPQDVLLRANSIGWATPPSGEAVLGNWDNGEWFKVTIELGSTDANVTVYDPVADTSAVHNLGAPKNNGVSDMLNEIYIGNYYPSSEDHRRRGYWDDISVEQVIPAGIPERDWASY